MLKIKLSRRKAQVSLEYALIIICLVSALLAMRGYIKRGIQGILRQSADELGQRYEPGNTKGTHTLTAQGTSITTVKTLSEEELNRLPDIYGHTYRFDLNENGVSGEDDVFGITTNTTLIDVGVTQVGTEEVF